jgi:hypothetical protein
MNKNWCIKFLEISLGRNLFVLLLATIYVVFPYGNTILGISIILINLVVEFLVFRTIKGRLQEEK